MNREAIKTAVHEVPFPGTDKGAEELGLLRTLKVEDNGTVKLALNYGDEPADDRKRYEIILDWEIRKVEGVRDVQIYQASRESSDTGQSGPGPGEKPVGEGAGPARGKKPAPPPKTPIPGVNRIIAVASGKGGVGKSTVAVNLAVALSHAGKRVGLLDADVFGPSVPIMLGLEGQLTQTSTGKIRPLEKFNLRVVSIGFAVGGGTPVIWRGLMVMKMIQNFLLNVEWGELDYLIVDLPPGTGDTQLTMAQTVPVTGAVIVTTPQDVSLADARKGFEMFHTVGVPVLGIVENMSTFICPRCGHESSIFSHDGGRRTAEEHNLPFLGAIPLNPEVCEGGDHGMPVAYAMPDSQEAATFTRIADNLEKRLAESI